MVDTKQETPSSANGATETNYLLWISYATIAGIWVASQLTLIPYVVHLMVLVAAILYAACHHSLILREVPSTDPSSTQPTQPTHEVLRQEDAYQFPLVGSVTLLGLYLAFKFLDKDLINLIISVYFCAVGCFAVYATLGPLVPNMGPSLVFKRTFNHPLPAFLMESPITIDINASSSKLLLLLASGVFCGFYFKYKHWAMNNVFGICFCLQGIERFSLGTYKIGMILLIGLFFYDIFWVFGTDVMVTVAKNLDGPIKILFPRGYNAESGKLELSLLGLGDIVIPGFFLALLLRFDCHNAEVSTVAPVNIHASFPKPYFHSALVGYILGLATTLYIMIVFNAAQPALLYLVPACLGSSLLCATIRGELGILFAYSEEEEEDTEEEKTQETKKND